MDLAAYRIDDPAVALRRDAHPFVFAALFLDRFGAEWTLWDPETTWIEVEEAWGQAPSLMARETIHALRTAMVSEAPWAYPWIFEKVCVAFNHGIADFSAYGSPSPGQILFAVRVLDRVDEEYELAATVWDQIAGWCWQAGVIWVNAELSLANRRLAGLSLADTRREAESLFHPMQGQDLEEIEVDEDEAASMSALKWRLAHEYARNMEETMIHG